MTTFAQFKPALQQLTRHAFHEESASLSCFFIPERSNDKIQTFYAPFDHVNTSAKLVLVGITPGRTQMNNALKAAAQALAQGLDDDQVIRLAKQTASFSGKMRDNLVAMLDRYGIHKRLGLQSCIDLWGSANHLVHFTSALRNPVFVMNAGKEQNYTGGSPKLKSYKPFRPALDELRSELLSIPDALILPMGKQVAELLQQMVKTGELPEQRVLSLGGSVVEFPHPSAANSESISLAMRSEFPTLDAYKTERLSLQRKEKAALNSAFLAVDEQRYLSVRASYWSRAQTTRRALESLA